MYSIKIKGKQNPSDPGMAKLEMIFFKTGYTRVPKILNVTGLWKNWNATNQLFNGETPEIITTNNILLEIKNKYHEVVKRWEREGKDWSPVQLSHCFDEVEEQKPQIKVKTILQMIEYLEEKFKNKKRIKNGHIIDSKPTAKIYATLRRSLQAFTKEKYNKAFSGYSFQNINETFLSDYAFYIKEKGIKNGNKGGITVKLRRLHAVCNYAKEEGMYVNIKAFECLGDELKWPETESKAVSDAILSKIENIDRTLFTPLEQFHLDLFLFSYYEGGMANVDVCYLTWDSIKEDTIVYERVKIRKTAKPLLLEKTKIILNKYRGKSYANFVFPVFTHKHTTAEKRSIRVTQLTHMVNKTLAKTCKILRIKEHITWYSARGSFISKMIDAGSNPYMVAEMAGNSPETIYKHYYKNTQKQELKATMDKIF